LSGVIEVSIKLGGFTMKLWKLNWSRKQAHPEAMEAYPRGSPWSYKG
jgi:hypothetical protein